MAERPLHVLFLCTENACRSQMAEGWLHALGDGRVRVSSAGSHPGVINPMTVLAMKEAGIDLSTHHAKGLDEVDTEAITHVITVCGNADQACPTFPGNVARLHWPIPDPKELTREFPTLVNDGFRAIRDNLRDRVSMLLLELDGH
jgi:arsenate reductase